MLRGHWERKQLLRASLCLQTARSSQPRRWGLALSQVPPPQGPRATPRRRPATQQAPLRLGMRAPCSPNGEHPRWGDGALGPDPPSQVSFDSGKLVPAAASAAPEATRLRLSRLRALEGLGRWPQGGLGLHFCHLTLPCPRLPRPRPRAGPGGETEGGLLVLLPGGLTERPPRLCTF